MSLQPGEDLKACFGGRGGEPLFICWEKNGSHMHLGQNPALGAEVFGCELREPCAKSPCNHYILGCPRDLTYKD